MIGGPIVSKVFETGVRYFEKRQEISEAKHNARMQVEAKKATADIDWDQIMAQNSSKSRNVLSVSSLDSRVGPQWSEGARRGP